VPHSPKIFQIIFDFRLAQAHHAPVHGNRLRYLAAPVDARALRVVCPDHPGLLIPVTNVKVSYSNNIRRTTNGKRMVAIYLEALCRYCDGYRYVEVQQGALASLALLDEPLPSREACMS
jgi:hypothetical protein